MEFCTEPAVLKIILVIKNVLKIFWVAIPLVLIILIMIDFFKAFTDSDELSKAIEKSFKRFIAAVIVFFVPTIVNVVFSVVSNTTETVIDCFTNASSEKITYYTTEKAINLVEKAKKTYDNLDYNNAISAVNKIKDEKEKTALIQELKDVKYVSELEQEAYDLEYNYNEEKYNDLYKKINNISNQSKKEKLINIIINAKKKQEEKPGAIVPLNIESGIHEQSDYDSEMRYVEVIPEGVTTNMPLIIYLHGNWAYASFSEGAPNYLITKYVKSGAAYKKEKFILIIPRVVLSEENEKILVTWKTNQGKEQTQKLKGLIDFIVEKYKIDSNRIIITGYSLGGDGTWNMVESYPNLFAAAVPISGCAGDKADASKYVQTAIKAFHGTGAKEDSYKQCVPNIYKKIKSAGGNIELVVKNGYSHGDMPNVYADNDGEIFNWMLSQKKK